MKIQKIVSGVLAVSMLASVGTVSALAADTEAAGISVRVQDQAGTSGTSCSTLTWAHRTRTKMTAP